MSQKYIFLSPAYACTSDKKWRIKEIQFTIGHSFVTEVSIERNTIWQNAKTVILGWSHIHSMVKAKTADQLVIRKRKKTI